MKDSISQPLFLLAILIFCAVARCADAESAQTLTLPTNLSGLTLFRVTNVSRHDERPSDGNYYELVQGIAEKSTGCIFKEFRIGIDGGELEPNGALPTEVRSGPPPGYFQKDQTYWLQTTSSPEVGWLCIPTLIGWWKSDDPQVSSFSSIVEADALRHHPHYSSTGLQVNYFQLNGGKIKVEVLRDKATMWSREFNGKPAAFLPLLLAEAKNIGDGFTPEQARINPKAPVIMVWTDEELNENNVYGAKQGSASIRRAFDAETGKPLHESIDYGRPFKDIAVFDSKTSKIVVSEKCRWNPDAPSPLLNLSKGRLEKSVEYFDPDSGDLKSTKNFIYGSHGWEAT